jgi:hypothetical protein
MRLGAEPGYRATVIHCTRLEVPAVWDEAAPFLEASLSRGIGDLSMQDLQNLCLSGGATLLTFIDPRGDMVGAAVTQLLRNPDGRMILRIIAFGTRNFEATRPCLVNVEEDAKTRGAQAAHFFGRPGWLKVCGAMGYQLKQVVMERVL